MNYTYRLAAAIMAVFLAGSAVRNSALSAPQQGEYATLAAAITAQYELIHDVMFSYVQVSRKDNVTVAGTLRFKQPNMFKSEIEVTGANPGYVLRNVSVFDGKFLWQQQTVSGDPSVRVIKSNLDAKQRQSESLLEQVDVCRQFSALKRDYEIISVREDRFEQRPVSVLKFRIRAEARAGMLQRLKASHSFDADNFPEEKNFYWDDAARFCAKLETLNNKQAVISTITYRGVIVNAQPEDSIFSYTPPDKAVIMDMTGVIGREIKRPEYNGTENEKAGTPGPGFALPDLFGKLFDSARVRGKIVVIGFWLAQSPECRGAVALLDTLYQDTAGEDDVAVFTLSRGKEAVLEYMDENGCTVPVLLDENGTVAAQFGVESVPRIFVIDQQGIIYTGYSGDRAGIRDALAKDIETLREKAEKSINKNKTRSQPRTDTLEKEYFR